MDGLRSAKIIGQFNPRTGCGTCRDHLRIGSWCRQDWNYGPPCWWNNGKLMHVCYWQVLKNCSNSHWGWIHLLRDSGWLIDQFVWLICEVRSMLFWTCLVDYILGFLALTVFLEPPCQSLLRFPSRLTSRSELGPAEFQTPLSVYEGRTAADFLS